jgi:hypothetical protein
MEYFWRCCLQFTELTDFHALIIGGLRFKCLIKLSTNFYSLSTDSFVTRSTLIPTSSNSSTLLPLNYQIVAFLITHTFFIWDGAPLFWEWLQVCKQPYWLLINIPRWILIGRLHHPTNSHLILWITITLSSKKIITLWESDCSPPQIDVSPGT